MIKSMAFTSHRRGPHIAVPRHLVGLPVAAS